MAQTRRIELTKGYFAIVDADRFDEIAQHKWWANVFKRTSTGKAHVRAVRLEAGKLVYMHRVIIDAPAGTIVDHINRDPLDNRRANLRFCDRSGNAANRASRSSTGYRGVVPQKKRFRAVVTARGVTHRVNGFVTAEDAARHHDLLARQHHGEFAVLNFPQQPEPPPAA